MGAAVLGGLAASRRLGRHAEELISGKRTPPSQAACLAKSSRNDPHACAAHTRTDGGPPRVCGSAAARPPLTVPASASAAADWIGAQVPSERYET